MNPMSDNKISEELYNDIKNLNEQAYKYAYDIWLEADKLHSSEAENLKEEASIIQGSFFRRLFDKLEENKKKLILDYAKADTDFADEFNGWFNKDLIFIPKFDDDIINALDLVIDYTKNKWFVVWLKEQDHGHSYLAKHQIEWIIENSYNYYKKSSKDLENNQIEKSDLEAISDDVNLIKNFFEKILKKVK
jgi:hypothetical protein